MTYFIGSSRTLPGNPPETVLGQLRTAESELVFQHTNDVVAKDPRRMIEELTGGGTSTHRPNEASVRMQVTAVAGDKVIRQSRWPMPYEAGRPQRIQMTFVMSAAAANNVKRVGQFDDNNGVFLEQTASGINIVRRSSVTGAPVDDTIAQASWNIDPFDGSGPSGLTLDLTLGQLLLIDYAWQSMAPIRVGFILTDSSGRSGIFYAHEFENSNIRATGWSSTAKLPVRYEIQNTGASAGTPYLDEVCAAVFSEGGYNGHDIVHGASTLQTALGATRVTVNSGIRAAIFGVRLRSGFNRASLQPAGVSVTTSTAAAFVLEITRGGTVSPTALSYLDVTEILQYGAGPIAGANITGDTTVWSSLAESATNSSKDLAGLIPAELWWSFSDVAGTTAESINVVVTPIGSAEDFYAALDWKERY